MKCIHFRYPFIFMLLIGIFIGSCGNKEGDDSEGDQQNATQEKNIKGPDFNKDSAYYFIKKQVNFGPRVPNTPSHARTAEWLINKMEAYADKVKVQEGKVTAYNGKTLGIKNIRATFNPDKNKKVLLCAHWDTRPFADMDTVNKDKPIPGANDGGSGTGVLLEIARKLSQRSPAIGVEIILFDAEDYGAPEGKQKRGQDNGYCLGSQYWAKRIDPNKYFVDYGILLDMVGAKKAIFKREGYSAQHAPQIMDKVWSTAYDLGYSGKFSYEKSPPVMDDHVNLIKHANIPTINIIDYDPQRPKGFGHYWHTHDDDMDIISKQTLKAVGQTVLATLFREKGLEN